MFCSQCGKQIPTNRTICEKCEDQMHYRQSFQNFTTPQESTPVQQPKKKRRLLPLIIIGILVLLLAVAAIWFFTRSDDDNSAGTGESNTGSAPTVLTVGDYKITATEFNYFYHELAAQCDTYASYLGIVMGIPLDEQNVESSDLSMTGILGIDTTCMDALTPVDGVYDFTWAELLSYNAMRNAASAHAVYQEAEKSGFQLGTAELENIESTIAEIKTYADSNSMSVDEYIEAVFGRDCDEKSYRHYLEVVNTPAAYLDTITFSAEEMTARYDESPEEFDTVDFYYYSTCASDYEDISDDPDAVARSAAESMLSDFSPDDEAVSTYTDYSIEYLTLYMSIPDEAIDWLYHEATTGEVKMFTIPDNYENTYVVLKFITRENYNTSYIELTMRSEWCSELTEAAIAACNYNKEAAMQANVSYY